MGREGTKVNNSENIKKNAISFQDLGGYVSPQLPLIAMKKYLGKNSEEVSPLLFQFQI